MIPRRRHTRDGTRRRTASLFTAIRGSLRSHDDPEAPRSDDVPATQETAASDAATAAAAAAALGDTATARAQAKLAARAAAKARSGANAVGTAASFTAAASAEAYAIAAFAYVIASISTYTTNAPQCRTRGGTATICGFSEYTTPSSPPKKYRVQTLHGEECLTKYVSGCSGSVSFGQRLMYSGSATYSESTCGTTNSQLQRYGFAMGTACGSIGSYSNSTPDMTVGSDWASAGLPTGASRTLTRTSVEIAFDAVCRSSAITTGPYGATLSSEDTENDAITRLQASASWSSWAAASDTTCKASYEQRTSGFSFAYTEAEFRDTISIPSGQTGLLKVGLYRRARGSSDPWVLYATEVFSLLGDGSNQDTIAFTYAADPGYETYAAGLPVGS